MDAQLMTSPVPNSPKLVIRSLQYRDLDAIAPLMSESSEVGQISISTSLEPAIQQVRRWYGILKFLSWFPNPWQHHFRAYVAESEARDSRGSRLWGAIQVSPFNRTRSTWRVERVWVEQVACQSEIGLEPKEIGSQLLRYCFETVWEARTWVLEVNVNEKDSIALYRQNGFQPLAQLTYWSLSPELLAQVAQQEPDLPNLLPISNADAQVLYQLDCVSMPPLLRQVFDRHLQDFKTSFLVALIAKVKQWCGRAETASGYVFEPQRKAAIGYFKLFLCKDGSHPHRAELTVHPAYTWLYPKLFSQMAQIAQTLPPQSLELVSADYQHEREEYLEQLGAQRIEHALLMSRSVWHKLRETKPEGLQLAEMLQGLQRVPRTPIPSRMSWWKWSSYQEGADAQPSSSPVSPTSQNGGALGESPDKPENGHHA